MALESLVTAAFAGGPAVAGVIDMGDSKTSGKYRNSFHGYLPNFSGTVAVLVREYMPRLKRGATGNCSREATPVTGITARE